jgi:protein arginine N-methyltransferase 1
MYSLEGYGKMIADRVRMEAYSEALRRAVRPESVVVDLGAGTGIMSCISVQVGAARVYAIDPSETLEVARTVARGNGLDDRIRFYQARSDAVTLPEPADVVVADLRGVLPAFPGNFQAIADARERFLKPGGVLIPQTDTVYVAIAEAPKEYEELLGGWTYGNLDLSAARRMVANSWIKRRVAAAQLLSSPAAWAKVDYRTVTGTALAGAVELEACRAGIAHALSAWFDAELVDGVGFSNAPGQPDAIYGQAFFPLLEPVALEPGDRVNVELRADLVGDDYVWSWNTRVRSPGGLPKAEFRQSTFFGTPLSKEQLRKRADNFAPNLSHSGALDRAILDLFGAKRSLHDISIEIAARFPDDFPGWKAALERVAALSARYAE